MNKTNRLVQELMTFYSNVMFNPKKMAAIFMVIFLVDDEYIGCLCADLLNVLLLLKHVLPETHRTPMNLVSACKSDHRTERT